MNVQAKITLLSCLFALLFSLTLPLVSEATRRTETTSEPSLTTPPSTTADEASSDAPPPSESNFPEGSSPLMTDVPSITGATTSETPTDDATSLQVYLHREDKIVTMTLEEYIVSVVAAEMPYTFHSEALKAQAVAARTYCLYQMQNGASHEGDADVCSNYAHCAAYVSEEELIERYGESVTARILNKVRAAVESTAGEILTYEGEPILAVFHSRSYAFTESCENVWGTYLPYLVSVATPEADSLSTVSVSREQLASLFAASSVEAVASYDPTCLFSEKNDSGRQDLLYYGGRVIKAKQLRSTLGFRSCRFEFEVTEDGWIFTVHGYGHGVGMSQYGANEMATSGCDYREILRHYYSGVEIEEM